MIFSLGLRSCPANKLVPQQSRDKDVPELGASKAPRVEALRVLPPVERGKLGIGGSKSLEGRAGHSGLLPPLLVPRTTSGQGRTELFYHMLDSRPIPFPDA